MRQILGSYLGSSAAWLVAAVAFAGTLQGQLPERLAGLSGEALYQGACANCHGLGGRGVDQALLGFEEVVPDFTDCQFAAREPDADWVAVAHEGGPARGFSEMMPAFRGALSPEQVTDVVGYIRTLCTDPNWPRGELNLPRPLLTTKAYPEDEWVIETGGSLTGESELSSAFVYERRFGPRSQFELVVPYGWRELPGAEVDGGGHWVGGLGDVALGLKHAVYHSSEAGTIFSLGVELVLPTGDEAKGLGAEGAMAEAYVSVGQLLLTNGFVQAQAGFEAPFHDAVNQGFARLVVGGSYSEANWGRTWSPMIELATKRALEGEAFTTLDIVPQLQVSLNTRQHVLGNIGLLIPATHTRGRSVRLLAYVLLDWFDGGFFEGW